MIREIYSSFKPNSRNERIFSFIIDDEIKTKKILQQIKTIDSKASLHYQANCTFIFTKAKNKIYSLLSKNFDVYSMFANENYISKKTFFRPKDNMFYLHFMAKNYEIKGFSKNECDDEQVNMESIFLGYYSLYDAIENAENFTTKFNLFPVVIIDCMPNTQQFIGKNDVYYVSFYGGINAIKGLNYVDFQYNVFDDKTGRVCSFVGFSSLMENSKAYIILSSKNVKIIESKRIVENVQSQNSMISSNINTGPLSNESSEMIQDSKSSSDSYDSSLFIPDPSLYYLYFKENPHVIKPNKFTPNGPLFGINNAKDVQRSFYLPDGKGPCTFLGFEDLSSFHKALHSKSVKVNAINEALYSFDPNKFVVNQGQSNSTSIFKPVPNLFYIYFFEIIHEVPPYKEKLLGKRVFGCYNIVEIQRNFHFPNDSTNYTFLGFQTPEEVDKAFYNTGISTNAINHKLFKLKKENALPELPDPPIHTISQTTNVQQPLNLSYAPRLIRVQRKVKEMAYDEIQIFKPEEKVLYACIQENEGNRPKVSIKSNKPIYRIRHLADAQRSFYLPGTQKLFSFFGFDNEYDLNDAVENSNMRSASLDFTVYRYEDLLSQNNEKTPSNNTPLYNDFSILYNIMQ